jgi:uncharacterized membrane protein YhfC
MINPMFLLSGIGMMLTGLIPVFWWRYRTLVSWRYFLLGAGVWAAAVAVKVALDLTFTPLLVKWLTGIYAGLGIAIISGAYVGLRTGLLESGLTYLVVLREKLKRMSFEQALALGLAFGCAEAFVLGLLSFLNVAVFLAFPEILDLVTPLQRAAILEQLTLPDIMVLAPIIERIFTVLVHVFCTVLVVQSVKSGRASYFILSFLYKTLLDGALPFLTMRFDAATVAGAYYIESFVVVLGLIGLVGLLWLRDKYGERKRPRVRKRVLLPSVVMITMIIMIAAFIAAQHSVATQLERRNVNFDGFEGRYDFLINGSMIGFSEFGYEGGTEYNGKSAFVIEEKTNLSSDDYEMYIEGTLYTTADAYPLFYNSSIHKNGETSNIMCDFRNGMVIQTVTRNNRSETSRVPVPDESFVIANNMISHWALMFRAARLEPHNTYIAHLYSPDVGAEIVRSFEVSDVRDIKIKGKTYEVYVFRESAGNLNYVTPEGELLKMENPLLEIVISEGEPEWGGIFR